jgi:hypothetical protein
MGILRGVFIVCLLLHIVASCGMVAFAYMELPPTLPISGPFFLVLFALATMGLFADLVCVILTQSATNTVGRPDTTATRVVAYIFLGLAAAANFFIMFALLMSYGKANTAAALASNPANDIEYCCVSEFNGHPDCPGVACTAGHKTHRWELRVDWRFLVLFWTNFGVLVLEIILLLLIPASAKKQKISTIGAVSSSSSSSSSSTSQPSSMQSPIAQPSGGTVQLTSLPPVDVQQKKIV